MLPQICGRNLAKKKQTKTKVTFFLFYRSEPHQMPTCMMLLIMCHCSVFKSSCRLHKSIISFLVSSLIVFDHRENDMKGVAQLRIESRKSQTSIETLVNPIQASRYCWTGHHQLQKSMLHHTLPLLYLSFWGSSAAISGGYRRGACFYIPGL